MRRMRPLRVLLFGLSFGVLLMGCPEPDPEGEDAGGGARDAGLSDMNSDAGVADAADPTWPRSTHASRTAPYRIAACPTAAQRTAAW